jgi:hypothetical protein
MPAPIHKIQPTLLTQRSDDGFVKYHEAVSDFGRPLIVREPYGFALHSVEAKQTLSGRCSELTHVSSRNLASVSISESGDQIWVVEDRLDAVSLRTLLDARNGEEKPLPPPLVLALTVGIAQALRELHMTPAMDARGPVLHLALCPERILIQRDGSIALCGYALAPDPLLPTAQHHDRPVGRLAYASPEQTYAGQRCTPASDLFALGSLLVEVLEGESPFRGTNRSDTIQRVRLARGERCAYTFGRALPMFADVLSKLLMVHPTQRWADPASFLEALGVENDARSTSELASEVLGLFQADPFALDLNVPVQEGLQLVVAPALSSSHVSPVVLEPPKGLLHEDHTDPTHASSEPPKPAGPESL